MSVASRTEADRRRALALQDAIQRVRHAMDSTRRACSLEVDSDFGDTLMKAHINLSRILAELELLQP
jgi:hypothetical protein